MTAPVSRGRRAGTASARPARARRRSPADVAVGAAAVAALAALTIGVPVALVTVLGLPVPRSMPSLSALTHPLGVVAVLRVLSVAVWLAWLQLVACVVAEIRAAVRNSGMPARIPLAGGTQPLVHRLVTAALLLASATSALSPAFVHPAPARPAHTISAAARPGGPAGIAEAAVTVMPAGRPDGAARTTGVAAKPETGHAAGTEKIYVVRPPVGRYHQSLWEIAENHLGSGRRYREIFELNKDRLQPDGSKLTIASLIRPGWVLRMPHDAHGQGIEVVTRGHGPREPAAGQAGHEGAGHEGAGREAAGQAGSGQGTDREGARAAGAGHEGAAGGAHRPSPGPDAVPGVAGGGGGHPVAGPGTPAGGQALGGHASGHGRRPAPQAPPAPGPYPYELAAASLLAAGLLSALGRRRREQLWTRAFGSRVSAPAEEAAEAEAALRLGASEASARMLDAGLRYLSRALASEGAAPPTVFAAHVSEQELDLWVAPAGHDAPAPWVAVGDGQVWRLPASAVPGLDPGQEAGTLAPYPGLVSIGTDATGRVLVDLESAHGLIAVTGPAGPVASALAAMAAELATNRWSDQMHITLAGFGGDLSALAPDRIAQVPTLAEALPALEARTAEVEEALAASGVDSVLTGRSRGLRPEAWSPHYLISAVPPSPAERDRLLALARSRHAAATGYVVAGEVAGATWTWELTEGGRLHAGLLGLDVQAQLLPKRHARAVVELLRAAARPAGEVLAGLSPDLVSQEQLDPESPMPVEITLLGPVSVRASGAIGLDRSALATELVVYLATHPGGVHPNVLSAAVWPRGATTDTRDAMLARVRDWLGTDGIGRPCLATDAGGRLRLGSQVRVDWHVFCAMVAKAALAGTPGQAPSGPDRGSLAGRDEEGWLALALSMVRGPFLDGREPGRYAWLATDGLEGEVAARVADAAHRLWQIRMGRGDPWAGMDAARAGLRLAFDDELLWRDLLRAAHATGRPGVLRDVVSELCARTALDEVLPKMAPETEALIDDLLPSWRSSVA